MVPPYCGCGWPKTAAARIRPADPRRTRPSLVTPRLSAGSSRSASSGPTGPGISRSTMLAVLLRGIEKAAHDLSKAPRVGYRPQMSGPFQHDDACPRDELAIAGRLVGVDDIVE